MKRFVLVIAMAALIAAAAVYAQPGLKQFGTRLVGYEEVPAISTGAGGRFHARISNDNSAIAYELSYSDLEGDVLQAHIHFAQEEVNGGVVLFLCSNLGNGPAGTPLCPDPPATVEGVLEAADVVGGAAVQGIAAGEFGEVIRAMRAGKTYVNVHSSLYTGGEIRGQLGHGRGRGPHD